MAKKIILNIKYEPDFEVIGIFAAAKNYRLCWLLNQKLSFNFSRKNDIHVTPYKSKIKEPFSMFFYENTNVKISYFLLNNRNGKSILIPEPKNLDFLMIIKSDALKMDIDYFIGNIRSISQVSTAIIFPELSKVKNLNSVLYDFELGLVEKTKN